ncbi:hypothetical protein NUU61_000094 [Penicillium alfredii]|uniref:MJ1316 RNA cyclic group end recognition domain-containing protein n=1 Tax=Penicillium alfredii TaxID=1506179 RepID=A0A9W9GAB8_9EURO|nr:uncharacterized protein NUU61_000094 [Penicillium alfredii]KAJ5114335.1 hypothetical protein NUU61_000094 [Penicillium alfredii]
MASTMPANDPIPPRDYHEATTELSGSPEPTSLQVAEKPRRSPSPGHGSKSGENKLRPAGDIINRINWDSNFEPADFIIGFLDRFEGQLEVGMGSWKKESTHEEFIPQHRVLYIRHVDGEIVWDRRRRIDKIFYSGNSAFSELAFLC